MLLLEREISLQIPQLKGMLPQALPWNFTMRISPLEKSKVIEGRVWQGRENDRNTSKFILHV